MTLPPITVAASTYRLTASVPGRTLATAVRTLWGWHLGTSAKRERLEWIAVDTRNEAMRAVYLLAAKRLAGAS